MKDQLSTKDSTSFHSKILEELLSRPKTEATGDLLQCGILLSFHLRPMDLHGVPRREVEKEPFFWENSQKWGNKPKGKPKWWEMLNDLIDIFEKNVFFSNSLSKTSNNVILESVWFLRIPPKIWDLQKISSFLWLDPGIIWNACVRQETNSPSSAPASVLGMFLCFGGAGVKKHGFTRPKWNIDSKDDGTCILLDMAIEFLRGIIFDFGHIFLECNQTWCKSIEHLGGW